MYIETGKTVYAQGEWDEELEKMRNTLRSYGKLLDRYDKETDKGFKSGFFIEWEGEEYFLRMMNGKTLSIGKLKKLNNKA